MSWEYGFSCERVTVRAKSLESGTCGCRISSFLGWELEFRAHALQGSRFRA